MTRGPLVLALLVAGAAAGAYAQDTLVKEPPDSTSVAWPGVIYAGSTCVGDHTPDSVEFYFRVTRQLKGDWVETEYAWSLPREYTRRVFKPMATPVKLNLQRLCSIRVASLE